MLRIATPAHAVDEFRGAITAYRAGAIDLDAFRRRRSAFGAYGLRGDPERLVMRIKLPLGRLTAGQLNRVAHVMEEFSLTRCHITTRQALQLYGVPLDAAPDVLRHLADAGMTSCGSAGNGVRNVATCPLAGACSKECFDVSPYAFAAAEYFHGNPAATGLPRKFKIAFSGCAKDCTLTATHDLGALAVCDDWPGRARRGFRIIVGGGLGVAPRAGKVIEAVTPVNLLIPTIEAVLRVFNALGDRTSRTRARIKFLVDRLGIETFRDLVLREREELCRAGTRFPQLPEPAAPAGALPAPRPMPGPAIEGYHRWLEANVHPTETPGILAATVRVPLGDLTAGQCSRLAELARAFGQGQLRTTPCQNIILPAVDHARIDRVYGTLAEMGLGAADAGRLPDVTSCPGAGTCQTGLTNSRGLVSALAPVLEKPEYRCAQLATLRVRVSGCNNGCGRHAAADIGFAGAVRPRHGRPVPHYDVFVGGGGRNGGAWFGHVIGRVPAKRAPDALDNLLAYCRLHREPGEPFRAFIERVGMDALAEQVRPFLDLPPPDAATDAYRDWDSQVPFEVPRGVRGESLA